VSDEKPIRERDWINTPEARQRRGERSLFAIDDAIRALENGKPIPENANRVLAEVSLETARASAWRMIRRFRTDTEETP
jgi:hypothetical protein